jgi:hypothetical protein
MKLVTNSESVIYFACAENCDHSEVRIFKFLARNPSDASKSKKQLIILGTAEDPLYFPYEQKTVRDSSVF